MFTAIIAIMVFIEHLLCCSVAFYKVTLITQQLSNSTEHAGASRGNSSVDVEICRQRSCYNFDQG